MFRDPEPSVQHVSDSVELHPAEFVGWIGCGWDPVYPCERAAERVVFCAFRQEPCR